MKNLLIFSVIIQTLFFPIKAQVLNVNNNEQLYDQWCWAGCSKTILDYYGFASTQCDIAEWVRTKATFYNFGNFNCCVNATQGCNYWNYNYGYSGSIQDILIQFGNLQNKGVAKPLTKSEITNEIKNNRLFVIRWGWSTGGGHFVVGHGINEDNIYFMNPWFGEGLHIGTYNFVLSGKDDTSAATHTWTHTNKITSNVLAIKNVSEEKAKSFFPNPFFSTTTLMSNKILKDATLEVYNSFGQLVREIKNCSGQSIVLSRDNLPIGLYFIRVIEDNKIFASDRLIISNN